MKRHTEKSCSECGWFVWKQRPEPGLAYRKEEKDFFETLDEQEKATGEAAGLGDEDDMP